LAVTIFLDNPVKINIYSCSIEVILCAVFGNVRYTTNSYETVYLLGPVQAATQAALERDGSVKKMLAYYALCGKMEVVFLVMGIEAKPVGIVDAR